ncbi:uncharacterized protein LOC132714985 isoform X2 [Ruditapes philippinarum]|uniref:uncharacterized protein LOC132714985 isoform X2 n=1 Tax=Ruditapes philippinarum TaxID=129788 RepID=UPI00295B31A9|nr:uncharacterized protein LOC132714985 isoform X2 [Ruditapes philippinarum]
MRVICSVILSCISLWISSIEAARWTEWKNLTTCSAKPCNCHVPKSGQKRKCEQGEIIMLRFCIHEEGDTQGCLWDKGVGAMKKEKCMNDGTNCPGWSDWQLGKCDCESNIRLIQRECNNPPPIHNDVLCKSDARDEVMHEEQTRVCNCTEEEMATTPTTTTSTTTTTTGASTTPLPCCKEDAYDYKSNDNGNALFGEPKKTTTTTTKKPSQVDLDYYDMYDELIEENPNCRNCTSAEIEAERNNTDSGNDGGYGDYENYYGDDNEDGGDSDYGGY